MIHDASVKLSWITGMHGKLYTRNLNEVIDQDQGGFRTSNNVMIRNCVTNQLWIQHSGLRCSNVFLSHCMHIISWLVELYLQCRNSDWLSVGFWCCQSGFCWLTGASPNDSCANADCQQGTCVPNENALVSILFPYTCKCNSGWSTLQNVIPLLQIPSLPCNVPNCK